jgi:hypothetical protein
LDTASFKSQLQTPAGRTHAIINRCMTPERAPYVPAVDRLCVREAARVLRRRFFRVFSLYLLSPSGLIHRERHFSGNVLDYAREFKSDMAWGLERGCLSRSVYFFFRHVDDVLDGDMDISEDPLQYVMNLSAQINSGNFTGNPEIGNLARYSLGVLERKARPGDNPRQKMIDVLGIMAFDHERARYRLTLSTKQLEDYYRCTFFPITDLMLIGLESQFRAVDIPALSYSQGRVYSVKDLEADWEVGIINIPKEVLDSASLTEHSLSEDVKRNPVVMSWFTGQLLESKKGLLGLQAGLAESSERLTSIVCNSMIWSMLRDVDKYVPTSERG